jgi:hypothetical protein
MANTIKPRAVAARRMLTLTTAATTAVVGFSTAAETQDIGTWQLNGNHIVLAQASGEGGGEGAAMSGEGAASGEGAGSGEGEGGSAGDPEQTLQRDMSFMEGHMRAGLKLYEAGDLAAAKTHMGHPIEEKYGAVADPLADRGFDRLRKQIEAVAVATEAEAPFADVRDAFEAARATMEEVRAGMSPRDQMLGLAALIRVAGDEYTVAVEGGEISNLHEYQDSWGFLRVVQTELEQMEASKDDALAHVAEESLAFLKLTDDAFGDIQGQGEMTLDPSILYGAAARIELEALELG